MKREMPTDITSVQGRRPGHGTVCWARSNLPILHGTWRGLYHMSCFVFYTCSARPGGDSDPHARRHRCLLPRHSHRQRQE